MRDWTKLVRQLKDAGVESPYLDRLRERLSVEESQQLIEQEIQEEMALALGRTAARVDLALLELELAERSLDGLLDRAALTKEDVRAELEAALALRDARHREAHRRRRDLLIHREAIGWRRHRPVLDHYPIPEPSAASVHREALPGRLAEPVRRVLVVSARCRVRGPAVRARFGKAPGLELRIAGILRRGRFGIRRSTLSWADVVLAMTDAEAEAVRALGARGPVVVLGVDDELAPHQLAPRLEARVPRAIAEAVRSSAAAAAPAARGPAR